MTELAVYTQTEKPAPEDAELTLINKPGLDISFNHPRRGPIMRRLLPSPGFVVDEEACVDYLRKKGVPDQEINTHAVNFNVSLKDALLRPSSSNYETKTSYIGVWPFESSRAVNWANYYLRHELTHCGQRSQDRSNCCIVT
jgi:hypothetical protein